MELTIIMKNYGWLSQERNQPRVEDLKPFLKAHNEKISGKREELISTGNLLISRNSQSSTFWKRKP